MCKAIKCMKLTSFFLFVATGLILCTSLSAQQYHDAAAFGLKGNVKECKVVYAIDGSNAEDPHGFCSLSFSKDGKLEAIEKMSHPDCERRISDIVRSNGLLMGFKSEYESSYGFIYDYDFRFHYNGNELIGFHTRYSFGQKVAHGPGIKGYNVYSFLGSGKDSFKQESFDFKRVSFSDRFEAMIEEGFEQGGNFIPKLESVAEEIWDIYYDRDYSQTKYIIKTRDSNGNYTVLTDEENGKSIKRIITYWDDEPASNYSITSTAPGIQLSTSKELTLKDLISKPLGVIENPSKSLWGIDPEKVIEYTQENKEWKCTESYGIYGIKEGFNWTFKGYPLDVDVRKYKYVNYSYGYGYYVTMGYKDQETKEAASREMEKLFNIVVQEFRDLGIELTQSQGKSWIRAEKTIGDMHYLVALNKPVEIDGKVLNQEYYVSIGIDKPL